MKKQGRKGLFDDSLIFNIKIYLQKIAWIKKFLILYFHKSPKLQHQKKSYIHFESEQRHKGKTSLMVCRAFSHKHRENFFFGIFEWEMNFLCAGISLLWLVRLCLSLSLSWNDKYHYVKINLWRNKFTFSSSLVALLVVWSEMKCFSTYLQSILAFIFFFGIYIVVDTACNGWWWWI